MKHDLIVHYAFACPNIISFLFKKKICKNLVKLVKFELGARIIKPKRTIFGTGDVPRTTCMMIRHLVY